MCFTPYNVKHKMTNTTIPVPCGRCPKCVARRTSGWSFRLMQEDRVSDSSLFITLTYDTDSVPFTKNGFMDLRKRDLQLFFKRLRKLTADQSRKINHQRLANRKNGLLYDKPIKYYAVGEYGGKTKRPHYHIILFNANVELIQKAWPQGQIHYGNVTGASVGYTMKYISKKWHPMHCNDDRTPQFALMSKDWVHLILLMRSKVGIRTLLYSILVCMLLYWMVKKHQCPGTIRIKSTLKRNENSLPIT